MTTARDIVYGAGRLIGVTRKGENLDADEAADGLESLNAMLGSWANDGLAVHSQTWENFTLTPGTATYTIGSSGTFNTTRPIQILHGYIREGTTDYPLKIVSEREFNWISDKSTTSNIPRYLNYDPQFTLGKIRLWETPSAANGLYINSEKQVTSFATLATSFSLPPGWEQAVKYNLAVKMAPEYAAEVSPIVMMEAAKSLGLLKSTRARQTDMAYHTDGGRSINILTGDY